MIKKIKFNYDCIGCGPIEHPQKIMNKLSKNGTEEIFKIIKATPYPTNDCWIFEVEYDDKCVFMSEKGMCYQPCYIRTIEE